MQSNMSIINVQNTVRCKSHLISKQHMVHKLCIYNSFCEKPLTKYHPYTLVRGSECLHSLHIVRKVIVHGEFSNEGEYRYLQQQQFLTHWFQNPLPLFLIRNLPYREFELIESFRIPMAVGERTQIRFVAGGVWLVLLVMGFCVVDNFLCRAGVLPDILHWHGHVRNACLNFSTTEKKVSNTKPLNGFQIDRVSQH